MLGLTFVQILWLFGILTLVNCNAVKDFKKTFVLKFVAQPTDATVAERSNVTIPCKAVSLSEATYKWIHNGTELKLTATSERYRLSKPDGNLTVINITQSESGGYRCIASNRFGSALSLKAEIRVAYLYGRNSINSTITATIYSSVQFSMNAIRSFPEAQFAWKVRKQGNHKLDEKIVDGESNGRLLISQSGNLYITGVQRVDTGTYTCVVSNPLIEKYITVEFTLTVLEVNVRYTVVLYPADAVDRHLSFHLPPVSTETITGAARVVFECIVATQVTGSSSQIPSITWHKNDSELDPVHDPKYSFPNGGNSRHKLIINQVGFKDAGWYNCIASTKSEVITSPPAQLTVNQKPALPSFKRRFPSVIKPYTGTDVSIDSHVSVGNVTWYKNAVKILSSSQSLRLSVVTNGSLLLRNVSEADDGLYQAFARTSRNEIRSPPVQLHVLARSPLRPTHPTTLVSSKAISIESLTANEPSRVPMTTAPAQQSTTNTHVNTKQQFTTGTHVTTKQKSTTGTHVTTHSAHKTTSTLLHHKWTTAASVAPYGSENKGKTPLLFYGTIGGGVLLLLLVIVAAFCFRTRARLRLRQGSMKLKSDSEEFEMTPVQPRNSSPARTISVRRLRNSNSKQDLLNIHNPDERRISLDTNENQFITSRDFQDHVSAHVNPMMTREQANTSTSRRQTTGIFEDEIRVLIENEPDDLTYDSGIEEEASDGLRRSPCHADFEVSEEIVECIPLYQAVQKSKNGNISCQNDTKNVRDKSVDKNVDEDLTKAPEVEPFYHVLEGPGNDCNDTQAKPGNGKAKTASFYQPLLLPVTEQGNLAKHVDTGHGQQEELLSSNTGFYQSLTPPQHDNLLNDKLDLTSEVDVSEKVGNDNEASKPSKANYQPLLHRTRPHLLSHSDRPRAVTGIYQPLIGSPENTVPLTRSSSAPQGTLWHALSQSLTSRNEQGNTDPVYQAVADEERCPLSLDYPSSSFSPTGRCSLIVSPEAQRRTINEPTYIAVQVSPPRQNRRTFSSENESRYSPSPCRKNPSTLQRSGSNAPVGHRRNRSEGGRTLCAMVNPSGGAGSSPPVGARPPRALPHHLGHRRNRSDIGLCPIDRSQEHLSRRLTSTSDSGIPRAPSLGSSVTQEYPRSAIDTTHCRIHIGP